MQDYISSTIKKILQKYKHTNNLSIIIPSKRAGVFIKDALKKELDHVTFLPKIISIEEFIEELSQLQSIDSITLLFEFYQTYLAHTPKDKIVEFDVFSSWATMLIQDFNEIDRFLIDPNYIFSYIKDIKRIENWFKDNESKTQILKNYLSFYDYILIYYTNLYEKLINKQIGYQGMQYREAAINIEFYLKTKSQNKYVFVGFNALNKAEKTIIKTLLENNMGDIYFDIDDFYIKEKIGASKFITDFKTNWSYFDKHEFNTIHNSFQTNTAKKEINIIGLPKNVSQMKQVGSILKNLKTTKNTALVLANENLLPIALNSLPKTIEHANITMGYALKNMALADLFSLLFKLHKNKNKIGNGKDYYYKDVLSLLKNSTISNFFNANSTTTHEKIGKHIHTENILFIQHQKLIDFGKNSHDKKILESLFADWKDTSSIINNCILILEILEDSNTNSLQKEYFDRFLNLFNQLKNLNKQYKYIQTLDELYTLYKQLLSNESLAFKGEALNGLQIMGMLETRLLNFETIIITSVNEGFLPAGKSNNSFIPFDVKCEIGLPTYHEKDAVYSYHFFRLISRATRVYVLYNTETDDFGSGEQSRFVTQLEQFKDKLPHKFTKQIISPAIINESLVLKEINKTSEIQNSLIEEAKRGFSPTTLTNYIYNPIAFYNQKILKINQLKEVEETIAANTLGNVIHNSLEDFYKPFIGKYITVKDIAVMLKNSPKMVTRHFKKEYKNGDISKGKNLLSFEVAKQYVGKFLNQELQLLKLGKKLKIIAIESPLKATINIEGINHPINLRGKADRIDELDGVIRIIDYKTGKVKQSDLNINKKWEELNSNYKNSKSFQVLMYAYMYIKMTNLSFDTSSIESGIISFKNLNANFMKVNNGLISLEDMEQFEISLFKLISELFDVKIPFIENENLPY
ncbi:MAG: PD-(D/E)XK nuclease family protein [Flavobacteriaceae bacterium]